MTTVNREHITKIRNQFCDAGQGHVFTWWDEISSAERDRLYKQLISIDLDLLQDLIKENLTQAPEQEKRTFEPSTIIKIPTTKNELDFQKKANLEGEKIIKSGQCAAFIAAGESETDLESQGIKGMFPITPVTGKSLFQIHVEKVIALRRRFKIKIPLFIMTSDENNTETIAFFEENDYFGFPQKDLYFLSQGMIPVVDFSGNLIMRDRGGICMNPDGHGGAIRALYSSGALDEMEDQGIEYIFYFQVDNPLVKVLDPAFLGYHHLANAEISSKIVRKTDPEEKVGVLGLIDGWLGVVEHYDLTKEEMYAKDEDGELKFYAGNIAIHIFNVSLVRKLCKSGFNLAFKKTEKTIEHVDKRGEKVKPLSPNAIQFESFIFDALRFAVASISMEVAREDEFSPFKNLEGENSPEICRAMMSKYYKRWLKLSGFKVDEDSSSHVEISPLFALDAAEFVKKVKEQRTLYSENLYVE